MDKLVYLVRGSEDGVIDIFTSKRRAFDAAIAYSNNPTITYPEFLNMFKTRYTIECGDGYGYGSVEKFYLK
jgi:hypothetical protein|tara:strand:+ start:588 stop:800 length:213 start_codon:yes stop_codon:yes gene_type:complete